MIKYILTVITWLLFFSWLMAQQKDGVVVSANPADTLFSSAMLEVKAEDKGLLIPRVEDISKVYPPTDGLMVFVTGTNRGYYYYDGTAKIWNRLRPSKSTDKDMISPPGTIIMYYGNITDFDRGIGKKGTDMEGWVLCNGENGTPNLSGKFVVGGGSGKMPQNYPDLTFPESYKQVGANENKEKTYKLDINTMPTHTHGVVKENLKVNITHGHDFTEPMEADRYGNEFQGHSSTYTSKHDERREDGRDDLRRRGGERGNQGSDRLTTIGTVSVRISEAEARLTFDSGTEDKLERHSAVSGKTHDTVDNRPSFYVLFYIMRAENIDLEALKNPIIYPVDVDN